MLTRTFFARAPLVPGRFAPLPVGAVSAQGATRDRLLALRGGLLSRCASVFPEAGEQSAWFGGPLGGGMHAPELLEAMLLTGAQLGDEELRREALRLCGRVVERQREDGSFGAPGETFAARGRMLRALCAAYSMSGDKQFLTFMLRYMKYLHDTLRVCALSAEDAMHTADTLEAGVLLYNVTGQKAILSVLMMLVSQGADYTSLFHAFPYRTPISRSFTARELLDALAHEDESGYTHHLLRSASGANLCEGLRASALCGVLTGSGKHLSAPEAGLARLNKAHGAAGGGVTADPLLSTSSSAYSKAAGYDSTTYEKEDGDIDGAFALGAAVTAENDDGSTAQIVWVSSGALLDEQSSSMVSGGNLDLFLNAISWMCGHEDGISIHSKSMNYEYLTISSSSASVMTAVIIWLIPALFLGTGVCVWLRRRRK